MTNRLSKTLFALSFIIVLLFGLQAEAQGEDSATQGNLPELVNELLNGCVPARKLQLSTLDLNQDGKCNTLDAKEFRALLGKCLTADRSVAARLLKLDIDCDGCITRKDEKAFMQACDGIETPLLSEMPKENR